MSTQLCDPHRVAARAMNSIAARSCRALKSRIANIAEYRNQRSHQRFPPNPEASSESISAHRATGSTQTRFACAWGGGGRRSGKRDADPLRPLHVLFDHVRLFDNDTTAIDDRLPIPRRAVRGVPCPRPARWPRHAWPPVGLVAGCLGWRVKPSSVGSGLKGSLPNGAFKLGEPAVWQAFCN